VNVLDETKHIPGGTQYKDRLT